VDLIERFGTALQPSIAAGLLTVDDTNVRFTRRGVLMSSEVLTAIL
jgi:hypothetical protein